VSEELRAELLRRAEQDQTARREPELDWELAISVDAGNLAWLRNVVADVGWPGRSMVGEDGAHAAWLLAQHADRDPAFQRKCLECMTEAADRGEASRAELAYLTDRVLLAEGRPQEYGTQMTARKEGWVPRRLRDPQHVDERRAAMSLGPLSEYIAEMERAYGRAKLMRIQCGGCGAGIDVWPPDEGEETSVTCPACGWTATLATGTT
jgi:ribosomal protein S27E